MQERSENKEFLTRSRWFSHKGKISDDENKFGSPQDPLISKTGPFEFGQTVKPSEAKVSKHAVAVPLPVNTEQTLVLGGSGLHVKTDNRT